MRSPVKGWFVAGLVLLTMVGTAHAQQTVRTQSYLLSNEFQDGQPPNSINETDMRDLIVSMFAVVPATISAAGTTQGTATSLSSQFNIITTCGASAGVIVTASPSYFKIWNVTASNCNVYPNSGAQINALGTNTAAVIAAGGTAECVMTSSTQGYCK